MTSGPSQFLHRLRMLSIAEGTSTLILIGIAMPLKYAAGMPQAVQFVGYLHGLLFVCLAVMLLVAVWRVPISLTLAFSGILAAVFPLGPFVFDRFLKPLADNNERDPEQQNSEEQNS